MTRLLLASLAAAALAGCAKPPLEGLDLFGQVPSQAALSECADKLGAAPDSVCERRVERGRVLTIERVRRSSGSYGLSWIVVRDEKDKALVKALLAGVLPEEMESSQRVDAHAKGKPAGPGVFVPEMAERSFLAPEVVTAKEAGKSFPALGKRFAVVVKNVSLGARDGMSREARKALVENPPPAAPPPPPAP